MDGADTHRSPVRAGAGLRRLVSLAALFAGFGAVGGVWASRLPTLKARLDLNSADIGAALFCAAAGACLAAAASTVVLRRLGPRGVGRLGAGGFAALLIGIGLAPGLPVLCLVMFLLGVMLGLFDIAVNADAVRAEGEHGRAVLSRLHGGYSLGLGAGAGSGAAAEAAGIGQLPHLAAAALLLAVVFAAASQGLSARVERRDGTVPPARWTAALLVLTGLGLCAMLAEGAATDWSALLVAETRGGGRALGAAALAVFALAMTAARFGGDWVVDRIGRLRTVFVGAALATAGLAAAAVLPHPAAALAAFAVAGVGVAPLFPNLTGLAAAESPGRPEAGVARIAATSYVAFLIGPAAMGWGAEHAGLPAVFGAVAILLAGAAALAWAASPSRRRLAKGASPR